MKLNNLHPCPLLERNDWKSLDGLWSFVFDDEQEGIKAEYYKREEFPLSIKVPFTYESKLSGIGDEKHHNAVWYERKFELSDTSGITLLHFSGVDYETKIWVNGAYVGNWIGGYTAFHFDITNYIKRGMNQIHVMVCDDKNPDQLRGKQRLRDENYDCWYVQSTGIWKSVWLERVQGYNYIKESAIHTYETGRVNFEIKLSNFIQKQKIKITLYYQEKELKNAIFDVTETHLIYDMQIEHPKLWSLESPELYDAIIELLNDDEIVGDTVHTYFGIRTISVREGKIYLNDQEIYERLILDQGYWEESLLTPPSCEALEKDILLAKQMGFNGLRKHQKIEDDRFYYLCDKVGMLVWGEIPSTYRYNSFMKEEFTDNALAILKQLKGHPSIVTWVVFNESWGIPTINEDRECQHFVESLCRLIKTFDNTRPIISNDGWFHLNSDVISLHEYEQNAEEFYRKYSEKEKVLTELCVNGYGTAFAEGYAYEGQPVLISEFGGVAMQEGEGWGYGEKANNLEQYKKRLEDIMECVQKLPYLSGFCYTQLTDVQQEINGLLYSDRTPKIAIEEIRKIVEGRN